MIRYGLLLHILLFSLLTGGCASASTLHDFFSDGSSLLPDAPAQPRQPCAGCRFNHDIAYWQGGTEEDRKRADNTLRQCVIERTGSKALADLMYDGVRAGGHPAFPAWYRWGYGWKYGRGYAPLTEQEKKQVREKLDSYQAGHPLGYCNEKHGP